jgi:hypothetical protein
MGLRLRLAIASTWKPRPKRSDNGKSIAEFAPIL